MIKGIKLGKYSSQLGANFYGSAGRNRGSVEVTLKDFPKEFFSGAVLPGTTTIQAAQGSCTLVYAPNGGDEKFVFLFEHEGASGSFHGVGIAELGGDRGVQIAQKHPGMKWGATSSSGGGSYSASVAVLRPGDPDLTIITSRSLRTLTK